MKDILVLVLTNFWPFVAAAIFLSIVAEGLAGVISALAEVILAFRRKS